MRGLVIAAVVALAACEEGVVLEVHVPEGSQATSVRLFVGFEECFDARGNKCPGLAPPPTTGGVREVLPGVVYHREPLDDQMVREAKVEGGVARFRIEAAGGQTKLPFAVAIDDLQQSAQYIPEISLDGARKYRIDLAPAMRGVLGKPATSTINVVEIWNQPTKMLPCMGFERWSGGNLVGDRVFVVPADDLDCDEVTTNECAPYAYKGQQPPSIEQTTCVSSFSFNDVSTCRLGGAACNDISGPSLSCSPSEYCLPSHYCNDQTNALCFNRVGIAGVAKCLFESEPSPVAKLVCTIGIKPSSDGNHNDLCQSTVLIESSLNMPDGVRCVAPTTSNLLLAPPADTTTPMLGFSEKVIYVTRNSTGSLPLEVRLRHEFDCKYKLELDGDVAAGMPFIDQQTNFAQFWVNRNAGPVRKLLVPIELTFGPCDSKCELKIDPLDDLADCLR